MNKFKPSIGSCCSIGRLLFISIGTCSLRILGALWIRTFCRTKPLRFEGNLEDNLEEYKEPEGKADEDIGIKLSPLSLLEISFGWCDDIDVLDEIYLFHLFV